jgi:hypothetical protein
VELDPPLGPEPEGAPDVAEHHEVELAAERPLEQVVAVDRQVGQAPVEREAAAAHAPEHGGRRGVVQVLRLRELDAIGAEQLPQAVDEPVREIVLEVRGDDEHARHGAPEGRPARGGRRRAAGQRAARASA